MKENDVDLADEIKKWSQGVASARQIADMAREIGTRRYSAGIPTLMKLLEHPDDIVRYNALTSLGYDLHYRPATDKSLIMLAEDPDDDVRGVAAGALGILCQDSKDQRVLQALGEAALHDPDEDIRRTAYISFLATSGIPREEHLQLLTNQQPSVDVGRVEKILSDNSN